MPIIPQLFFGPVLTGAETTSWTRTYGGAQSDGAQSVQQTAGGGYIMAGLTQSYGPGLPHTNVWLVLTDGSGNPFWTRAIGGDSSELAYSVQQTLDGGFAVAGYTENGRGGRDVYLIKTNSNGDTLWTKSYGGTGYDEGYSVQQTRDTGYVIAGYTNSFWNGNQAYLIKTNASGDTLWTKTYGGAGFEDGRSVQQTQEGSYVFAGASSSFGRYYQVYLVKTNASGDTLWTRTFGGDSLDGGYSVRQTSDGGYIIAGLTDPPGGGNDYDVYLIKTDANGSSGVETAEVRGQRLEVRVTAKPNPFTSFASVPGHEGERFSLYDVSGRMVGNYKGDRVGEGLAAGVYFLRSSDSKDKPLRVVKVR